MADPLRLQILFFIANHRQIFSLLFKQESADNVGMSDESNPPTGVPVAVERPPLLLILKEFTLCISCFAFAGIVAFLVLLVVQDVTTHKVGQFTGLIFVGGAVLSSPAFLLTLVLCFKGRSTAEERPSLIVNRMRKPAILLFKLSAILLSSNLPLFALEIEGRLGAKKAARYEHPGHLLDSTTMEFLEREARLELPCCSGASADAALKDLNEYHQSSWFPVRQIILRNTEITDAGLAYLAGRKELRYLSLSDTRVTDAGLEHLKDLTKLEWLDLKKTQVTPGGIKALQQALPGCMIVGDP